MKQINKQEQIHNSLVTKLYQNFGDFFNTKVDEIYMNYELYFNNQLYIVPDIFAKTSSGLYYVEVKSSNSKECKIKGIHQCYRTREWIRHTFPNEMKDSKIYLVRPTIYSKNVDRLYDSLEKILYN